MADFDPFANQGGPAAWDPEHEDDSKKQADELLNNLSEDSEPGTEPGDLGGDADDAQADPEVDLEFDEGDTEAVDED